MDREKRQGEITDPKVLRVHDEWTALLAEMVAERRADHIDDHATDEEIAFAILEKLVELGVVKKNAGGKYILPLLHRP